MSQWISASSPSARRAWLVCLGCSIALFTVMGLGVNAFTVYQPYLLEVEQFTNAQASWITTVRSLFGMLSMATADTLCRRLGLRWTILSASLVLLTASGPTVALQFFPVSLMAMGEWSLLLLLSPTGSTQSADLPWD